MYICKSCEYNEYKPYRDNNRQINANKVVNDNNVKYVLNVNNKNYILNFINV